MRCSIKVTLKKKVVIYKTLKVKLLHIVQPILRKKGVENENLICHRNLEAHTEFRNRL